MPNDENLLNLHANDDLLKTYEHLSLEDKILAILDFCSPLNGQEFKDEAKAEGATVGILRISITKIRTALVPLLNRKIFVPTGVPRWQPDAVAPGNGIRDLVKKVDTHVAAGAAQ